MAECNAVDFIEMVCVVDQDNDCVPTFQLFRFKTFRDRIERFLILKALLAVWVLGVLATPVDTTRNIAWAFAAEGVPLMRP